MTLPDLSKPTTLHGTAAAIGARGVLILGTSGSGKSSLALSLLAYGAELISDDRVRLSELASLPWLSKPRGLPPLIEARNVGLLKANLCDGAWLSLVVNMSAVETDRLPVGRNVSALGHSVPLVHKVENSHFPTAILQYLKCGRSD